MTNSPALRPSVTTTFRPLLDADGYAALLDLFLGIDQQDIAACLVE